MRRNDRKRRGTPIVGIALAIIAVLAVCTVAAIVIAGLIRNRNISMSGSWYRELDLTESVDKRICAWLGEESVDDLSPVKVKLVLNIEETDTESLYNYSISVDEDSYKEAYESARADFGKEIEKMVLNKTGQAGYDLKEDEVRTVIEEALSMSLDDYVKDYLPALLSDYEDLNEDYAESGSFSLKDSQITWNTDGEERQETWVMQDNLLIFSGVTDRVYRRPED